MSKANGYVVVIEKAEDGTFSAFVPDLPGCVTSGQTLHEVEGLIHEAVVAHIESLQRHGDRIPQPSARTMIVPAA